MNLLFKYGNIYRNVLISLKIDLCSLNGIRKKNKTLLNRWVAALADIFEDTAPGQIHDCPYSVSLFSWIFKNNLHRSLFYRT